MLPLMLHRSCDLGPVRAITAAIHATPQGCAAAFRIEGHIPAIVLPAPVAPERRDNLWETTCCEVFWQPLGGMAYREFNLSPSGAWAAYDFDFFRQGMREAPVDAIAVACAHNAGEVVLKASIAADLPAPAQVALSAVIQHRDGARQFWALAFPPGAPEFHSEAGRQLIVER